MTASRSASDRSYRRRSAGWRSGSAIATPRSRLRSSRDPCDLQSALRGASAARSLRQRRGAHAGRTGNTADPEKDQTRPSPPAAWSRAPTSSSAESSSERGQPAVWAVHFAVGAALLVQRQLMCSVDVAALDSGVAGAQDHRSLRRDHGGCNRSVRSWPRSRRSRLPLSGFHSDRHLMVCGAQRHRRKAPRTARTC